MTTIIDYIGSIQESLNRIRRDLKAHHDDPPGPLVKDLLTGLDEQAAYTQTVIHHINKDRIVTP